MKKGYYKDSEGQHWYETSLNVRYKAEKFNCVLCGEESLKVKGKRNRSGRYYCSKSCAAKDGGGLKGMKGEAHYSWKGGRNVIKNGYIEIWAPKHPHARGGKYVREHRLVMEEHIGRYLEPHELVHHLNGVKNDNRIENLKIVTNETHKGEIECPFCHKDFLIQ